MYGLFQKDYVRQLNSLIRTCNFYSKSFLNMIYDLVNTSETENINLIRVRYRKEGSTQEAVMRGASNIHQINNSKADPPD